MKSHDRADYAALGDRMVLLLGLRTGLAIVVVGWGAVRPEVLGLPFIALAMGSGLFVAASLGGELVWHPMPTNASRLSPSLVASRRASGLAQYV